MAYLYHETIEKLSKFLNSINISDYDSIWVIFATIYLPIIFTGMKYMNGSDKFCKILKYPFFVWNVILAVYSIFIFSHLLPFVIEHFIIDNRFNPSRLNNVVCINTDGQAKWLLTSFGVSKLVEFGDTFFLILKGKTPDFLHWFHHISILLFSWYIYKINIDLALWSSFSNSLVHSIMYTYFALATIGIKVYGAELLTSLQIIQMIFGAYVFYMYPYCDNNYDRLLYSFGISLYVVYAFYFLEFFLERYIFSSRNGSRKKVKQV